MDKLERVVLLIMQCAMTAVMIVVCAKLCVGCTTVSKEKAEETIAFVLKEAYTHGGKSAVSNRIEQLVVEGKITSDQALVLHGTAEKVYQDVLLHLEDDSVTNEVSTVK